MAYNSEIHHRRSIRLRGYDYSLKGAYFITICLKDKVSLFGEVVSGKMELNESGRMINRWWLKIPEKFTGVELDSYIIMPNHFHGIIFIHPVGADPCVCPVCDVPCVCPVCDDTNFNVPTEILDTCEEGKHVGLPLQDKNKFEKKTDLPKTIQWFKTMTTNEYIRNVKINNWKPFNNKLWQRNYYDHIIRNEKSLNAIRKYIIENPLKWHLDRNNPSEEYKKYNFKNIHEINNFNQYHP